MSETWENIPGSAQKNSLFLHHTDITNIMYMKLCVFQDVFRVFHRKKAGEWNGCGKGRSWISGWIGKNNGTGRLRDTKSLAFFHRYPIGSWKYSISFQLVPVKNPENRKILSAIPVPIADSIVI